MPLSRTAVLTLAAALAVPTLGLTPAAHAGPILQPASASTDMGTALGGPSPNNTRNQSGLSIPYTSLVTDFDAYLASNPTHNSNPGGNIWASSGGTSAGNFDYDLGGTFTIESLVLWNFGGNGPNSLRGFTLLADDNAAFSSPVTLGSFDADPNGPMSAVSAQVFTFAPTSASFVRLNITSNNGSSTGTIFGEAAFEVSSPAAVPEPGTLALALVALLGLAGLGARGRRSAV